MPSKPLVRVSFVLLAGIAISTVIASDKEKKATPAAEIEKLAWMAGTWTGTLGGTPLTERWAAPAAGVILASAHVGSDPAKAMYELMLIEEKNGKPTLFLRHFYKHLTTREKKPMEFTLTSLQGRKAVFESTQAGLQFTRITYTRTADQLEVELAGKGENARSIRSKMKRQ